MKPPILPTRSLRAIESAALPPAVVLGTSVTGLSEARALSAHGIPVIGVDETVRRYTSYSSAWTAHVTSRGFNDGGLIGDLELIAAACGRTPALFISTDEQVKIVAEHAEQIRRSYRFDFPARETVDLLMSKESFTAHAREKGWPIPPTIVARSQAELDEGEVRLRYPVILKPRIKTLASRQNAPQKAYRCADKSALDRAYREVARWEPEVVVQEFIPGPDSQVHYSFHYFTATMDELCSFEGHKIRQWIPEVGSTASSEPVHPEVVSPLSREVLRATACAGFCSVEYKRDSRTGAFYITEPTVGRVNLQLGTALANGADIVSRAYYHVQGLEYPDRMERTYDRKWVYLSADYQSARHAVRQGSLTWGAWLGSLRGPKAFAVWRARDLGMWSAALRDFVTRVPRALARRAGLRRANRSGLGGRRFAK